MTTQNNGFRKEIGTFGGISIIGGLTISTVLTLIYVPSMFCIFGAVGVKNKRRKLKQQRELNAYWKEHSAEETFKKK